MSTIKAYQLIPLLKKWADVCELEPGYTPDFSTLEEDGVEEYVIPDNEMWTINGEAISQINIEGEIDGPINLVLYVNTYDNVSYMFDLNEDIDLGPFKRYQLLPVQFETSSHSLAIDTVGYHYLLNQAKYQTIYAVTDDPTRETFLGDLIDEDGLYDCLDSVLVCNMLYKSQEWCDDNIDQISDWLNQYGVIEKVRKKYALIETR